MRKYCRNLDLHSTTTMLQSITTKFRAKYQLCMQELILNLTIHLEKSDKFPELSSGVMWRFIKPRNPSWRHQMETYSALLTLCAGNSPVTGEFPAQRPATRNFDVSFICAWINGWANNREAGDSRRHRGHYDVMVMQGLTASDCEGITNLNYQKYGDIFYNLCAADRWE